MGESYAQNSSRSRHHCVCLMDAEIPTTPSPRSNLNTPSRPFSMQFSAMQSTLALSPFSDFDLGSTPMHNLIKTTSVPNFPENSTLSVAMTMYNMYITHI